MSTPRVGPAIDQASKVSQGPVPAAKAVKMNLNGAAGEGNEQRLDAEKASGQEITGEQGQGEGRKAVEQEAMDRETKPGSKLEELEQREWDMGLLAKKVAVFDSAVGLVESYGRGMDMAQHGGGAGEMMTVGARAAGIGSRALEAKNAMDMLRNRAPKGIDALAGKVTPMVNPRDLRNVPAPELSRMEPALLRDRYIESVMLESRENRADRRGVVSENTINAFNQVHPEIAKAVSERLHIKVGDVYTRIMQGSMAYGKSIGLKMQRDNGMLSFIEAASAQSAVKMAGNIPVQQKEQPAIPAMDRAFTGGTLNTVLMQRSKATVEMRELLQAQLGGDPSKLKQAMENLKVIAGADIYKLYEKMGDALKTQSPEKVATPWQKM